LKCAGKWTWRPECVIFVAGGGGSGGAVIIGTVAVVALAFGLKVVFLQLALFTV
jgi:hypothetical protein